MVYTGGLAAGLANRYTKAEVDTLLSGGSSTSRRDYIPAEDFVLGTDTVAGQCIQRAADYALENNKAVVSIPEGIWPVLDTLHLGYGVGAFATLSLEGAHSYTASAAYGDPRTQIVSTFVDRPIINIQGGRNVQIRKLAIKGGTPMGNVTTMTLAQRADAASYVPAG